MSSNLNVKVVTGSATGNPRNKTALKPGFSLVGWIRLGSSGEDLTGLKGKFIQVSHQELAKHNKIEDCWMAIRGKVYNVTRYMEYHPGGAEQLMRGAGKDATSLFDEYHAWVNIEQLLAKCFVGPLRNTVTLNLKDSSSNMDIRTRLSPPSSSLLKFPSILSASTEALSKGPFTDKPTSPIPPKAEIIPRFDWIQKTTELSLYFYTKSFCNPGVLIEFKDEKESEIKIIIANTNNSYNFSFLKPLKWPCSVKVNQETGKIEITFEKVIPELWSNFGIFERTRSKEETCYNEYSIVSRDFFNDDSFELLLRPMNQQLFVVPVGYHFTVKLKVHDKDVIRSYTPIPLNYYTKEAITMQLDILFLIKTYNDGALSKHLSQDSSNQLVNVSQPKGNLDLNRLKAHSKFAMMAAGSGITPMISVLEHLLERNSSKIDSLKLYFFNKTESDIWLRETFDAICRKDGRFTVKHILSDADKTSWSGDTGRVSKQLVEEITETSTFILICGPPVFNDTITEYLGECHVETHFFQG